MNKLIMILLSCIVSINAQESIDDLFSYEKDRYLKAVHSQNILYPGDSTIDITYYKLNLTIDWRPDFLKGEVTVAGKSLASGLASFFLDLSSTLTIDSIIQGEKNLSFTHQNDIINIYPVDLLELNATFSITIYYGGIPGSTDLRSFTFGEHEGAPSIYTLSEPYGAKDWWPCKDTPSDKADSSDVWLTVRNDLTAVSNGKLIEIVNNGDTKTFKWKNKYPIAQYLISLAVSNYAVFEQTFFYPFNIQMPVIHYIYPEHMEQVKPELEKTIGMLDIFSDLFGQYPFLDEKYGHAEFGWGGGMEHQTISSMGSFNENIISHELAHQWFGDKITCRDWHNIWLNEGFATYATGLYFEKIYNRSVYDSYINIQFANAKQAEGSLYVTDISSITEIFDGLRSYSKGAAVIHMLRGVTGDSLFFEILKTYANDPSLAFGTAITEDFQRNAQTVYGGNLNWFFDQWVYGVKYPKYKVSWNFEQVSGEIYNVKLSIEQQQNESPSYFTMPLRVNIKTSFADTTIIVFNDQMEQSFNLEVKGKPLDLIVDPDNYVLKEILYTNTGNEELPVDYILKQNYPNPFNSETTIDFSIPVTASGQSYVRINIYDIAGNKVGTIFEGILSAGNYTTTLNSANLRKGMSSGVYIYSLETDKAVLNRKMSLVK